MAVYPYSNWKAQMIAQTVAQIKATLARRGVDVDDHLNGMSHMAAIEARRHGKPFTTREHVEGLVLAQLKQSAAMEADRG